MGSTQKKSTISLNDRTLNISGQPIQEDLNANPSYWKEDRIRRVEEPFVLKTFLDTHQEKIIASNETDLFDSKLYKSDVKLLGHGQGIKCTLLEWYLFTVKILVTISTSFPLLKHLHIYRCKKANIRWRRNVFVATKGHFKHYYGQ